MSAPFIPSGRVTVENAQRGETLRLDSRQNHLVLIETVKSLTAAEGTWTVTFRDMGPRGQRWSHLIEANDLVTISLGHGGDRDTGGDVVMVGLVDEVAVSDQVAGTGARQIEARMRGRDLTKLFTEFHISNSYTINDKNVLGRGEDFQIFDVVAFAGAIEPPEMIEKMFAALKARNYPRIKFPSWQGKTWLDLVRRECRSEVRVLGAVAARFSGAIWDLLKEVGQPPFHELWLDTWGGTPVLTLRPTPYSDLESVLPNFIVPEQWMQRDWGRSDREVVNVVFLAFEYWEKGGMVPIDPAIHAASLERFGIRERWIRTNIIPVDYAPRDPAKDPALEEQQQQQENYRLLALPLQRKMLNWYGRADLLYSGYCAVRGNPALRIGTTAVFRDAAMRFYIEAVRHRASWGDMPSYVTGLTLTRGAPYRVRVE